MASELLKIIEEKNRQLREVRDENAAMRALLMLARGLIINDSKPAAVSIFVSKHNAFLAQHKEQADA